MLWKCPANAVREHSVLTQFMGYQTRLAVAVSRFERGIPSHDRFNAILAAIKPAEFEKCLLNWITALHAITGGQVIAIDGKTLCRSFDAAHAGWDNAT